MDVDKLTNWFGVHAIGIYDDPMQEGASQSELFSANDLAVIQPTGSPWVISQDDPATVPVPTQTTIVSVEGPYNERDRKLWVFLLHAVFDELGKTPMHSLSVREINSVFREVSGQHDSKWIWESARRLAKTLAEWKTVGGLGDERFEELGMGTLLFANLNKRHRSAGTLHFGFPPNLIPIIKEPMRFARLRVHFLLSLSGKYAVTLYEVLEGFANRRDGRCEVAIEDLRQWLCVPEGTYKEWRDFRKRVLAPAVKQINDDPIGAGFSIEYKAIRESHAYSRIVFQLTKTDNRQATEKLMRQRSAAKRKAAEKKRPAIKAETYEKARKVAKGLDIYAIEADLWAMWEEGGKQPFKKNADAAFIALVKKRAAA